MSLRRNRSCFTQRIKAESGSLCFCESLSSDWFGEGQCLDSIVGLGSQNGLSHSLQPFQVLPVLSLRSGLSVVLACCSHSSPSGSHWPCTGPFSSSLDGRSALHPSESYTQRCLCQRWSPALKEEVMVRL